VRRHGWLPLCKDRRKIVKAGKSRHGERRIRYLTFCAIGAIDVLMLDIAKVVTRSGLGRFDNVVFFDKTIEDVEKTSRAIPGAIGFPAEFLSTILLQDDEGESVLDEPSPLDTPVNERDTLQVREVQRSKESHHKYKKCFPFDILNFDLEKFFFIPNDPMPGKMVQALRKVFDWQKRTGIDRKGKPVAVDSFSLMFTTRIGPPNLTIEYLTQLEQCLVSNIDANPSLRAAFSSRVGHDNVARLRDADFLEFFRLALPKVVASALMETGWMVDPEEGIKLFEITRPSASGPYQMLHLTMHVKKQPPSLPGVQSFDIVTGHTKVIEQLFREQELQVTDEFVETMKDELQQDLNKIIARRKKYASGRQ
jgi:hypothetical protein